MTDDSLIRCISEVRSAIGDEDQRIVKTVPRRGYLLDGPVLPRHEPRESRTSETAPTLQSQKETDPIALPGRPSIVVLPFANLSGKSEEDYLSNGVSEDIVTELSRFSELRVIARHSSFQYKGKAVDEGQIGHELGVNYVLQGSVRRGNDRVRITAQLVDAETGAHLWGERYDRKSR